MAKKTSPQWLPNYAFCVRPYTLCIKEADYLAVLKTEGVEPTGTWLEGNARGMTHFFSAWGEQLAIICVDPSLPDAELMSVLAHEAVHVAMEQFDAMAEDKPGGEIVAYTVENIVHNLIKSYREQTDAKPKRPKDNKRKAKR